MLSERMIPLASSTPALFPSTLAGERKFSHSAVVRTCILEKANLNSGQNRVDILLMVDTEQTSIPFLATCIIFHIVNNKKNCWFR